MEKKQSKKSKQHQVIDKLLSICKNKNNFIFHNKTVKEVSVKCGFGNPFTATKFDNQKLLSQTLLNEDFAVIHLGKGFHQFVKGIKKVYHQFEPIEKEIEWKYKKSILNQYNTSESNMLSVANNQRILHHFLFGQDTEFDDIDITKRPKTYFPHRTKSSLEYNFGNEKITCNKVQIEIDLTIEFQGIIGIFEGKNGKPISFNTIQLYHPFLYYYNANKTVELQGKIKEIFCVYVVREKSKTYDTIKLWAYTFENPLDITTIKFIKSSAYNLINQNAQ
ncbi:MAG: hypothetical protein A3H98_09050 [Bacteroidetes bacterium RIFCSPLOWO2_02_FULL_36_8]|nr:MAG: hypothetical protein A3H98_09050 [Bacteroidetes bacterium RIFCSPLOWO2_02_FULL_36_8]OFY70472.1 MAG: hypothetical protein A3G23_10125 [Bacteroidetes bacterium RIFCSPLOWO2_12_FULL_37_12]